jgi:hypothetical protein
MKKSVVSAVWGLLAVPGQAMAATPVVADSGTITQREAFLAVAIAAMILCGLISFFLAGRVSQKTHVALAMLVALIGGFSLLVLFGLAGGETPLVGGLILFALIGLFKLMNQFEVQRRPAGGRSDRPTDAVKPQP